MGWSATNLPDQSGRRVVVTGGNGGLGLETARQLAAAGAEVLIAARNAEKCDAAVASIGRSVPGARVSWRSLDLSSQAAVREFTAWYLDQRSPLDLLVNNAGVMALPFSRTVDGWEKQLATNHFGHFALTLGLMPALQARPGARVVTVASGMHWVGSWPEGDVDAEAGYSPWARYALTKLCNLLFTAELDRRLRAAGAQVAALAAQPGYAATDLQFVASRETGERVQSALMWLGNHTIAQSAEAGAWPTVRAATDPEAQGGEYWGPRVLGWFGAPARAARSRAAQDAELAGRLWALSEARTGLSLALAGGSR